MTQSRWANRETHVRGIKVSEVFNYAGGPFNNAVENPRVAGRDPQGRSLTFDGPSPRRPTRQKCSSATARTSSATKSIPLIGTHPKML
jgi:hypothetical protein